jgi:hypothetical protein
MSAPRMVRQRLVIAETGEPITDYLYLEDIQAILATLIYSFRQQLDFQFEGDAEPLRKMKAGRS